MPKLRRMSGREVVSILCRFGFTEESHRGSHVKLLRINASGERQVLIIPLHGDLDTGTCRAILRQAGRHLPEDDLRPHFYAGE